MPGVSIKYLDDFGGGWLLEIEVSRVRPRERQAVPSALGQHAARRDFPASDSQRPISVLCFGRTVPETNASYLEHWLKALKSGLLVG
jgi:hypothetical protein